MLWATKKEARTRSDATKDEEWDITSESAFLGLYGIIDWWMNGLEKNARAHGVPTLSRPQGMLVSRILEGEHRPIRIAEKMGMTRQAIHFQINQLVELKVLKLRQDPDDRRALIVELAPQRAGPGAFYAAVIRELQLKLTERLGKKDIETFRKIVRSDWGEPPILSKKDVEQATRNLGR